jgi:hypothetical protein
LLLPLAVILTLSFTLSACTPAPPLTAAIQEARTAKDPAGHQPTTTYAPGDTFYCVVELAHAPESTRLRAFWSAIEVAGAPPNTPIGEAELTSGSGSLHFNLSNENLWPVGRYKVELYLNGQLDRTLEFDVQEAIAAPPPAEALPTSTPVPPTSTPPPPTPTPPPTITGASLVPDLENSEPTTIFRPEETFYCVVTLAAPLPETRVKAVWTAAQAEGVEPDTLIDEEELTPVADRQQLAFALDNDKLWPFGQYQVDLYLNGEFDRTLEFQVGDEEAIAAATAQAQPPSETPTVAAGLPEPTATPAVRAPMTFQAGLYTHPSGAISFPVPEGWRLINEDSTSITFGDGQSAVIALFIDAGEPYNDGQMQEFINTFVERVIGQMADDYEVVTQKLQPDGSTYVGLVYYASAERSGDADFFFEQRGRVIFVLYFISPDYAALYPTWEHIFQNYKVNAQAALGQ